MTNIATHVALHAILPDTKTNVSSLPHDNRCNELFPAQAHAKIFATPDEKEHADNKLSRATLRETLLWTIKPTHALVIYPGFRIMFLELNVRCKLSTSPPYARL